MEESVSHKMLADIVRSGFAEQRESVRRVYQRCDALAAEVASVRAEQARIAENSSHLAVGIDRVETALASRIDEVAARSLSWGRVGSDTLKLVVKSAPVVVPLVTAVALLRGWIEALWPFGRG